MYLRGEVSLELVPQGTLIERLRAHAAGIPAFYTATGASSPVEAGTIPIRYNEGGAANGVAIQGVQKEAREIHGRRFIRERNYQVPNGPSTPDLARSPGMHLFGFCLILFERQVMMRALDFWEGWDSGTRRWHDVGLDSGP